MKEMYDIDDFIKQRVQEHVSDVPPYIWDNIQRKRSYPYTLLNFFRVRWRSVSLIVALFALLWVLVYQQKGNDNQLLIQSTNERIDSERRMDYYKDSQHTVIENGQYSATDLKNGHYSFEGDNADSPFKNGYEWSNSLANNTQNLTTKNKTADSFHASNNSLADRKEKNPTRTTSNKLQVSNSDYTHTNRTPNNNENKNSSGLMDLDSKWVRSAYSLDNNANATYPYGPPIKHYKNIPYNDYSRLKVEDLPQILEVIPLNNNILQIKEANSEKTEIGEESITESLLNEQIAGEKLLKEEEKEKKKEAPRKPKKKKQQWLWVDLVAAPHYVIKNLNSYEATQQSNEYVNARLETEQSKFGYTIGVRTSFRLHDVSEIRTGILYSKITENFEYQRPSEIDPITGEETTFALETNKNKYQFIDIPILIGYREDRKVFDFNVNFGILLNLAFTQQGRILDPESLASIDLRGTEDSPIFKSSSGLALYSSVGYNYKFSDRVHLLIEPSMKYVVRPINHWEYPVRQRFHTFGLTTGLRFNIGR